MKGAFGWLACSWLLLVWHSDGTPQPEAKAVGGIFDINSLLTERLFKSHNNLHLPRTGPRSHLHDPLAFGGGHQFPGSGHSPLAGLPGGHNLNGLHPSLHGDHGITTLQDVLGLHDPHNLPDHGAGLTDLGPLSQGHREPLLGGGHDLFAGQGHDLFQGQGHDLLSGAQASITLSDLLALRDQLSFSNPHPLNHPHSARTPNALAAAKLAAQHDLLGSFHHLQHQDTGLLRPDTIISPQHISGGPTLADQVPAGSCELICSIMDLLVYNPQFSTFLSLIRAVDVLPLLSHPGPITIFAPVNSAFDAIPHNNFTQMLLNHDLLQEVMLRHMTRGRISARDILGDEPVTLITGAGEEVILTGYPGTRLTITSRAGQARVISADNHASNGIIHVIDSIF